MPTHNFHSLESGRCTRHDSSKLRQKKYSAIISTKPPKIGRNANSESPLGRNGTAPATDRLTRTANIKTTVTPIPNTHGGLANGRLGAVSYTHLTLPTNREV